MVLVIRARKDLTCDCKGITVKRRSTPTAGDKIHGQLLSFNGNAWYNKSPNNGTEQGEALLT